jgi:hypothetical protein
MFRFVSPDYFRLVPWAGDGLKPVGYGFDSVEALVQAARDVNAAADRKEGDAAIAARQKKIEEISQRGLLATPGNSWINELVTEAARISIVQDGQPVVIEYEPKPCVRVRS